jgi:hypothetical protein
VNFETASPGTAPGPAFETPTDANQTMAIRNRKRHGKFPAEPPDDSPAPPPCLDQLAREVWVTAGEYLASSGLLGTGDLPGLACSATLVSRIHHLEEELQAIGRVGPDGKPSPLISAINRMNGAAKGWALGLHLARYSRLALSEGMKVQKEAASAGTEWDGVIPLPSKRATR